ncbi:MAG: AMP-dependent synthetase [Flavobacteriales bacterium]|nr:MAG: AMP-dependent synthetase [Flavobacteriales bacterium]
MSWRPDKEIVEHSNIYKVMQQHHFNDYNTFWEWSVTKREQFWDTTIKNLGLKFKNNYTRIVNLDKGVTQPQWLFGATLNIVDSCFKNDSSATAVVYQKENGELTTLSQSQLEELVNKIANSFSRFKVTTGDCIAIYMPMTVEAVSIYLAAIKAGIQVATVADSFTPNEIAIRLKISNPKLIFTQDVLPRAGKILPLYEKVEKANGPKAIVIKVSDEKIALRNGDVYWDDFLSDNIQFKSVPQSPDDVITILFSSGTTGAPKAIPWTHTTPIKAASDGFYHHNIQKNDVVCWPTNLGWMMGPWLIFATLINNAAIGLYYGAPLGESFGRFVQNAKVTMLGVIPSIVKQWIKTQCMENVDWKSIKCFSSTGEVSNPKEMDYLMNLAGNKPVIEYCGGTEIGGGYVTGTVIQENIPSTFSSQALGTSFILLDEDGKPADKGEVFIIPPIIGLSNTLLNKDHHKTYYEGTPKYKGRQLRRHGDQLQRMKNGYYKAMGRVDDAMNLGGIKVSSVQIEAVINHLNFVKESAAIAVAPLDGGPGELVVYYVPNKCELSEEELTKIAAKSIKTELNPLFKLSKLIKIDALPRTASNKVMRCKLRDMYDSIV